MDKVRRVWCALFGCTPVAKTFFGYVHCARCGAMRGDSLAGAYRPGIIVGHTTDCDECRENYAKLRWHQKVLVPYPFQETTDAPA